MPLIESSYVSPALLRHGDIHTVLPHLQGPMPLPAAIETLVPLPDGDELEVYLHQRPGHKGIVIVSHGLEGSIRSPYVSDAAIRMQLAEFTVITWNMRGCGSRPNRLLPWYHSGDTKDLALVVSWVLSHKDLRGLPVFLFSFSVGGNITLRLLSQNNAVLAGVRAAVCVSVPVDLGGSALTLSAQRNRRYMKYLLAPLKARMRTKAIQFPGAVNLLGLDQITTFREFDSRYTAPLHGFSSVEEYWDTQSSLPILGQITTPTLLLSSRDDPFLSPSCFPEIAPAKNPQLFCEYPAHGGHVGFLESILSRKRWVSQRAVQFFSHYL